MNGPDFTESLKPLANPSTIDSEITLTPEQLARAERFVVLETNTVTLRLPHILWRYLRGPLNTRTDTEIQDVLEEALINHLMWNKEGRSNLIYLYSVLVHGGDEYLADVYKTQGASREQDTADTTHNTGP